MVLLHYYQVSRIGTCVGAKIFDRYSFDDEKFFLRFTVAQLTTFESLVWLTISCYVICCRPQESLKYYDSSHTIYAKISIVSNEQGTRAYRNANRGLKARDA